MFEHFNSFIIRILGERDIKYYQLKAQLCAHLTRLICCDESEYMLKHIKDDDFNYVFNIYKCIDYSTKFNCSDKEQTQYFQYLQRILMPPGYLFQLLFVNYDAQFTQPNIVYQLFDLLTKLYEESIGKQKQP